MTGGCLAIRGGYKAARNSAIMCAVFLAVIEGVGIGFQRMMADNTKLEVSFAPPVADCEDVSTNFEINLFSCLLHHHPNKRRLHKLRLTRYICIKIISPTLEFCIACTISMCYFSIRSPFAGVRLGYTYKQAWRDVFSSVIYIALGIYKQSTRLFHSSIRELW